MKRHTPLRRSGPIKRSTKPIAKRGAAKARKEKRYKSFLSSAAWKRLRKAALVRAGYRCQNVPAYKVVGHTTYYAFCQSTSPLTVHHSTYARFGGDELPEDLEVLCRDCHNALHAREGKRIAS